MPNDRDEPTFDAIKPYLLNLDRAIVARGGQSIYAPKPDGGFANEAAFDAWERERLDVKPIQPDPDDGFYRRYSSLGKLHLVRRT